MKLSIALFASLMGVVAAQEDCYNTTEALAIAQATDPRSNDVRGVYTLCPGLELTVGFPANEAFTAFSFGGFPLAVLRPNTTIDGNGVVLSGGLIQFATLAAYVFEGTPFTDPKSGTIIKNIVFDGTGLTPAGGFPSQSMFISAPGDYVVSNITFKNIAYGIGDAQSRPIFVGPSDIAQLAPLTPPNSISFTLEDSTFVNVTTSNGTSVFLSENQTIAAKNVIYENVEALAALSVDGATGSATVENVCISGSKFSFATLAAREGDVGLYPSISGLYIADSVENESCAASENLFSSPGRDNSGTCSSVETVDSCFATPMDPTSPTDAPANGTATDPPASAA
ncbi:unnamed protein product, partial [Cylindrotheca closterium]